MKRYIFGLVIVLLSAVFFSCQNSSQGPDNIPIYSYPPQNNQSEAGSQSNPLVSSSPPQTNTNDEFVERNIIVDERNSIFSIGIPAGYTETTEVTAQAPIDFWFEYLPAEAYLEVNGTEVQRNPHSWETKIRYTQSVTKFDYKIINTTGKYISYNLRLVPSTITASVPVVVRQRWTP